MLVAQRIIIKWNSWVKVGLFQIRDAAANSAGVCFTVDRQIVGHLPHNYTLAGSTLYVGCYSGGGFMYSGKIRNVKVFRGWSPLTMRSIVSTSLPTATATTVALVTTSLVNQVSGRSVTVINNVSMSGYNKYGSPSILMGSNSGLYLDGRDVMLGDGSDFEISMEIYLTAYPSNYAIVMGKFFNYALKDNRNSFLVQMGTSGELFLSVASNGQMQTSAYSPVYAVASNGSYKTCGCMLNTPHIVTVRKVGNCYKMLLDGKVLKTQYIDGNITWVAPNDGDQYGRLWFGSWINAAYRPITGSILWIKVDKSRVDDYPETVV